VKSGTFQDAAKSKSRRPSNDGNLAHMKVALALLLILLLILLALPIGMGHMGDCPACTSAQTLALGLCAGILSLVAMIVLLSSARFRPMSDAARRFLLARSIYRPPRFV
jgi:hypothetical protein